jgi:hypothetical protein
MKRGKELSSAEAQHGEKMIEVKIRFWTNNISRTKGQIVPKHAWSAGVVRMEPNKSHGIVPESPEPFHTLMDVTAVVEKVLVRHGVVLHMSRKLRKYLSD